MIVRVGNRRRFTIIDNAPIEDARLSFRALGVLAYLLSKPDTWQANYRQLATAHSEGESAVRSALRELDQAGYVERKRMRQPSGEFEWVQIIHETPDAAKAQVAPCGGLPRMDNQPLEDHALISAPLVKTEETSTDEKARPADQIVDNGDGPPGKFDRTPVNDGIAQQRKTLRERVS